jgi:hypothetical protein
VLLITSIRKAHAGASQHTYHYLKALLHGNRTVTVTLELITNDEVTIAAVLLQQRSARMI